PGLHPGALGGARRTALTMRERLEDAETGGFWDRPAGGEPGRLGTREKPIEENALAADGLLRLAALTGDDRWRETAVRALRAFVGEYRRWGQFAAAYAGAVARALAEPLLITVVGPGDDETANALWRAARAAVHPARAIERLEPARDADRIGALALPKARVATGGFSVQGAIAGAIVGALFAVALVVFGGEAMRANLVAVFLGAPALIVAFAAIGALFGRAKLFKPRRYERYERVVGMGDALVTVSGPSAELARARTLLERHGATAIRREDTGEAV